VSRSARHNFILIVVTLSGCLAAFGGWRFAKASAPVNGPIVLVSIDSLRADRLPSYGYAAGKTPAIDALAADSTVFERAYAHVPETLPAHAALLTGRLPFETGVRDVAGFTLPGSFRTIAELLRDRGYATGGIVSSYLLRKDTGIGRGFAFFDAELPEPDDRAPNAWLMRDGAESEQVAEHWLDSAGTSRAFLFLHIAEPHAPYAAPARFSAMTAYDAEVAYADEIVGRLVRYLKAHQLYDRTTFVLLSDHGEGLGDHGEQAHGLLTYEEALRIPLIVKQPGGENAKRRVAAPVQQIDLVPTILDLAKAPGAGGLRGRSLVPLLNGGTIPDAFIYAESTYGAYRFGWAPLTTIISGKYQLVASGTGTELFDLSVAPGVRQDIAAEKPDVVAALRKRLAEFKGPDVQPKPAPVTPTDRARFEMLGYVGVPGTVAVSGTEQPSAADNVEFVEHFRSAIRLAAGTDGKDALDAFAALAREQPHVEDVWMHLARTAARIERHDVALSAYHRVLELEPGSVAAHLGVAASSLRTRKLDDTQVHVAAVLDDDKADAVQKAEGHELLARVALTRKDAGLARAEAVAAETADPLRPVRAFVEGRIALDQARYSEAVAAFDEALAAAASAGRAPLADLRVYAADALVRVERGDEARDLLNAELNAFPANVRARAALQSLSRGRDRDAVAQH
jgi:arylsulfatase A-like enzyme/tetratricopeptide (TPR) repeat protein